MKSVIVFKNQMQRDLTLAAPGFIFLYNFFLWSVRGETHLIEDIEMGYVTTVIVKDLSRLGRDYVSIGQYTDNFSYEHNIRFIAVNDLVDSNDGDNGIAPFKNIMNEMYARDISRKVRYSHRIRDNLGER